MTPERLRFAQHLIADKTRTIPQTCRELGDIPSSTLYHYLHADCTLKDSGQRRGSMNSEFERLGFGQRPILSRHGWQCEAIDETSLAREKAGK
jgi:hypothetical protein